MQEFPYILSEYEDINSLLYKPINSTQRIKYTCFNTSPNYIILGSTSGSIYLFSRRPCSFLQLIPLSEGAVSHVLISPDEKTVALATLRGSVCLVALKPVPKLLAVSTEHVSKQIKCLCWNDNSSEIYVGDNAGKVSVMVLSIFTVNGMFQAPVCTLMNLDSTIVQLSFCHPLLLVSTLTRCYVCNTVQEQYKQIGNKTRNGEFGACFYKTSTETDKSTASTHKKEKLANKKHSFNFIPEGDNNLLEENFPKMFCARPGSRLWEVSANGTVTKTHQFRETLATPPSTISKPNTKTFIEKKHSDQTWMPQSINFSQLFILAEKYLFSYTSNGLYVIDPTSATVLLWNNEFTNIFMADTIENRIYLMTTDGEFHCLTLSTLDSLILQLYHRKDYNECLQVCLSYRPQLQKSINNTEINKLCHIESKLRVLKDDELSTLLHPITLLLQSSVDTSPKKLESGIVVVHSGNKDLQDDIGRHVRCSSQVVTSDHEERNEQVASVDPTMNEIARQSRSEDMNYNKSPSLRVEADNGADVEADSTDITRRIQADLEVVYSLASNIRPSMSEKELERIMSDVEHRMDVIKDTYEPLDELRSFVYEVMRSAELYYFNTLLENVSLQLIHSMSSRDVTKRLTKAFVNINTQSCGRCGCDYPCPSKQLVEPKFLAIGKSLLRKLADGNQVECINLCNKVPYMLREYLPAFVERQGQVKELLRQALQSTDTIVLSLLMPLLGTEEWTLAGRYLMEMKEGRCLFCGVSTTEENEIGIDWNAVTREIMKKRGPDHAMAFLSKLEKAAPNVPIDRSIFQSLVFTKILYQHGMKCAVDFNKSPLESSEYNAICSAKVRDQLVDVLKKDLGNPIDKSIFGSGAHHWGMRYQGVSSTCPCCTLSLQTPVLLGNNGIAIFCCGHAYHVNCMIERKLTTCNLHS